MKSNVKTYVAPDGFVYDYKHLEEGQEHLNAKYLTITFFDNIDNYILTEDKNVKKN